MYNPKKDKKEQEAKFYGNYRGEVVDVQDPMKAGRVKIRVFSIYDDLSEESLPWAIMADPFMGGQAGLGGFFVPDVGSHVWVFFETGDSEQPVYFAGAPAKPHFPPERNTNYPFNHVYKTKSGHLIEINDGASIIHVLHNSGTEVWVDADGNVLENIVGNVTRNISGNVTESVGGNYTSNVSGDVVITGDTINLN